MGTVLGHVLVLYPSDRLGIRLIDDQMKKCTSFLTLVNWIKEFVWNAYTAPKIKYVWTKFWVIFWENKALNVAWIHICESILYHLRVTDRGQVEVKERDEKTLQLSDQQQQNHTISKLDSKPTEHWNIESDKGSNHWVYFYQKKACKQ